MSEQDFYKINPEVKVSELVNFNLYRKLSHSGGRPAFVQFHRKGTPFGIGIPSMMYIRSDEIEEFLRCVPNARVNQRKLPCGKIAFMLMTNWFENKILKNDELDSRSKIELTAHCLNESLRFIQCNNTSIKDCCDSLHKISSNLVSFIYCLLNDDQNRDSLLVEIFYRSKNNLSHGVRVCLYTCFVTAIIHSLRDVTFEPQLIAASIIGIMMHDDHLWHDTWSKGSMSENSLIPSESKDLCLHLNTIYERDYKDIQPATPLFRIATIADAFDELTACNHSYYVFSYMDAFIYLKQRLNDKLYKPYFEIFMRAFCAHAKELSVEAV